MEYMPVKHQHSIQLFVRHILVGRINFDVWIEIDAWIEMEDEGLVQIQRRPFGGMPCGLQDG
jgi:hypothetical protein